MPQPSSLFLPVAAALCLLLSSCICSVNPISSPQTAKPDLALVGNWTDNTRPVAGTGRIFVTHSPWMRAVSFDAKGRELKGSGDIINFFPSTLGKDAFLNVLDVETTPHGPVKSYLFYRYQVSDGHVLRIWAIADKPVLKAVRSGKLKGTITPGDHDSVLIQDSSENIQAFIIRSHPHKLFNGAPITILYKR